MDEDELREYAEDAQKHGIPYMLDRMGLDGLGNDVVALHKRILELEAQVDELEGITHVLEDMQADAALRAGVIVAAAMGLVEN